MRIAALVLAILGALAAVGLGVLFLVAQSQPQALATRAMARDILRSPTMPEAARQQMRAALARQQALPYFLLAALPLSIFGAVLAMKRRGLWAALLLLLSGLGPVLLLVGYLLVVTEGPRDRPGGSEALTIFFSPSALLILAALFAVFCKKLPEASQPISRKGSHHDAG